MASHTHSELELAAEVFAGAARSAGLEPESMAPAPVERQIAEAEPQELPGGSYAGYSEGLAYLPEGPFDFERETAGARAA
jgi:hypothetical protein